jgi:ankyrin repeat protein
VKKLIELGADIHYKDNEGNTPLQICLSNNHNELSKLLKELGAQCE